MEGYLYLCVLQIKQIAFLEVHIGLLKWVLQFSLSLKYPLICHTITYFREPNRFLVTIKKHLISGFLVCKSLGIALTHSLLLPRQNTILRTSSKVLQEQTHFFKILKIFKIFSTAASGL